MKYILSFSLMLTLTSFNEFVVTKKYWSCAMHLEYGNRQWFGSVIIEAKSKNEAIGKFNKWKKSKDDLSKATFTPCQDCDNKISFTIDEITDKTIIR